MDNKDDKIRPVKTSGRKVVNKSYDWDDFDRRTGKKRAKNDNDTVEKKSSSIRLLSENEIKKRYQQQMRKQQLKMKRIRALLIFMSTVILVAILAFMTPIFNIRTISVSGNNIVTLEEIDAQIGSLVGENLFKTGSKEVKKRLKNIAYIDEAQITKRLFPPSVKVEVAECRPSGYISINGYNVVLNTELKVLDDKNRLSSEQIPEIKGAGNDKYTIGDIFKTDSSEKDEILSSLLKDLENLELISKVNEIDISKTTGIEFTYENRIKVLCGTQLDLERKLNLFRETILSNNIDENAKGTMDLTVTGKAVFDR